MASNPITPITASQRALLELTVSSGSTEHPFTKALARMLAGEGSRVDAQLLANTVRNEPHWLERNLAICALIDADLEELVPPAKAAESPDILKGIVAELKRKLGDALKQIEDSAKEVDSEKSKVDELGGKLAEALKDNESLKSLLDKLTKPEAPKPDDTKKDASKK